MDPIESIKPYKDSSLAMLIAAQNKNWNLFYIKQDGLYLEENIVLADCQLLKVFDNNEHWFELEEQRNISANELDVILMRVDPPFDMEYIYTTYLLEKLEQQGSLILINPLA